MFLLKKKFGLALGGGGAKGIFHIGVLRVLEKNKLIPDMISGTSIGSLVGAMFASGMTTEEIQNKAELFIDSDEFKDSSVGKLSKILTEVKNNSFSEKFYRGFNKLSLMQLLYKPGLFGKEDYHELIDYLVPDVKIEDLKISFRAIATDLKTGALIVMSKGSLRDAVLASCNVPMAFEPVKINGLELVDGGVASQVPVNTLRKEGMDIIVAVPVNSLELSKEAEYDSAIDVLERIADIIQIHLQNSEIREADLVVENESQAINWTDFKSSLKLIEEGEIKALEIMPKLKSLLRRRLWI